MDYDIAPIEASEDEALVRWVAMLLIEGKSESEIRRSLVQNHLIESALSLDGWKSLLLASTSEAKELRSMVVNRAELGSTDWLRLDSYTRRKRTMNRMERMIDLSEAQADSISKMSSVAFMANGLVKAQESMDKFTGAQEAVPQVQVNISYDPLDQFRGVIQAESKSAIISNTDWSIITDEEE
mgnify:CR=1 FL=1|tara:strand:- start:239 stop:787 length:549 start_codon:yes stop_codon:yes gene_type:complete